MDLMFTRGRQDWPPAVCRYPPARHGSGGGSVIVLLDGDLARRAWLDAAPGDGAGCHRAGLAGRRAADPGRM